MVFIGAASGDDPRYYTAVKNHFADRLGCHTDNLNLSDLSQRPSKDEFRATILNADIVYVGGGNPTRLMETLQETGADEILLEAYNKGVVMSGNSAGGCLWFECFDNEEDEDYDGTEATLKTKPGLGLVPGYFVPHWNTKEETRKEENSVPKDEIIKMLAREAKSGYAVDEGAAIMFQSDGDKQMMSEIVSKPGAKIYKLNPNKSQICHMVRRPTGNLR